jgi:transposase-like protein
MVELLLASERIWVNKKLVLNLAIQKASQKWTIPIRDWNSAMNRFAIEYEECFPNI